MLPVGVKQDGVNKDLAELKAAETKRKTVFEAMECLGGFASRMSIMMGGDMCIEGAGEISWMLWSV